MRHVKIGRAAREFDGRFEDDDGGGAIDVVVAVNQHFLFALDGGFQAIQRRLHSAHLERIVKMG